MLGGRRRMSIPTADAPPVRAQSAPPPTRSPSLLVGSGSRTARTTNATPAALSPRDTATAAHSRGDNRALIPIAARDWLCGSMPTRASSIRDTGARDRYAFASRVSQPFSLVRIVSPGGGVGALLHGMCMPQCDGKAAPSPAPAPRRGDGEAAPTLHPPGLSTTVDSG
jgi:hypothetical protein